MIEPETIPSTQKLTPLRLLLWQNLLAALLVFCLLQAWRPCFFLTDDNLSGGLPLICEMGRHLWHGESPFYTDYIFGGHYDLLRDPTFFSWHPIVFIVSLLEPTPLRLFSVDIIALFFLIVSVCGFIVLVDYLRREYRLPISDSRILFFNLSLHFSLYLLSVGSSWCNFLANQSALPWLVLGLLHRSSRTGFGLIFLFTVHEILGGHPEPTISNGVILSLLALGLAVTGKTWRPLWIWATGNLAALVLLSPLLWVALSGFYHSTRGEGLTATGISEYSVDTGFFVFSYFAGTLSGIIHFNHKPPLPVFSFSFFLANAAAWYLLPVLMSRAKWTTLEKICSGLIILLAVLIIRPLWISEIMLHVPLLKSMRWPFREMMQLLFFLHLLFILRTPGGSLFFQRASLAFGCIIFIAPFFFTPKPTLNPLILDRGYLFSGKAEAYWNRIRPLFRPGEKYVVIEDVHLCFTSKVGVPDILTGSHNYPMLFKLPSASGYSSTTPRDQAHLNVVPVWFIGAFLPSQKNDLMRENPNLKIITLESITPLKITLSSRNGPTIDLTQYLDRP